MSLAARFHGPADIRLHDEPVPTVAAGQSLVEMTAVGLCGSDLHWYVEGGIGDATLTRPLVGGHELAGIVRGGPRDGQRVAVDPSIPCRHCDMCACGHRNLCRNVRFAGHSSVDGGLQQFLAWPDELLYELPGGISDAEGAMLEPLGVAVHAFDLAHVPVGASVAVLGCGPIGLCLLQVARVAGASMVVAADPLGHRRHAAAALGASVVLDPGSSDYTAQLAEATHGVGVDIAFEMAGTDEAISAAVEVVRPGGRVVLGGIPSSDHSSFPASTARRKGLTLVMVRRMKDVYPRTIAMVRDGRVDVSSIVSDVFPLGEVQDAFAFAVARDGLKVIVTPNG
jgi:L-iditol 2-dehydrogenase